MSEHDEEQTAAQPPAAQPSGAAGWRERVYGVRAVAAVAVAGLLVGGGAGAAIHAATDDDGRDGRPGRMGFQRGPGQMPGQMPGQGGPGQGQVPPQAPNAPSS